MENEINILFICSRNQWRSPTGEAIYKSQQNVRAKSAGTSPSARIKVSAKLLDWAELIFVMEKKHKHRLQEFFPDQIASKKIIVLDIPDEYQFMDEELIENIKAGVDPFLIS